MRIAFASIGLLAVVWATPLSAASTTTYIYDDLNRLWKVCYDNNTDIIYNYDPGGNRSQVVIQSTSGTCP